MRTEIDRFGCLHIHAETETERFALSQWYDGFCDSYEPVDDPKKRFYGIAVHFGRDDGGD